MLEKLKILREKYTVSNVACWDSCEDECNFSIEFGYRGISNSAYRLRPRVLNPDLCYIDQNLFHLPILRFQKEASSYLRNICGSDELLWLQYAQHYGVPTRLLDFSSNPLVALYFACRDTGADGALWVLNITTYEYLTVSDYMHLNNLDKLSHKEYLETVLHAEDGKGLYPVYFIPEYIDPRMNVQSSRFMLWPNRRFDFESILKERNYMNLSAGDSGYVQYALRFRIPCECKHCILSDLDLLGVNEKALFPGLDSIGSYINFLFQPPGESFRA